MPSVRIRYKYTPAAQRTQGNLPVLTLALGEERKNIVCNYKLIYMQVYARNNATCVVQKVQARNLFKAGPGLDMSFCEE